MQINTTTSNLVHARPLKKVSYLVFKVQKGYYSLVMVCRGVSYAGLIKIYFCM